VSAPTTSAKGRLVNCIPAIVTVAFLLSAPLLLGTAIVSLLTKILIFALLAMSLDISFGYTGLWSFGHAAIFGVAAYTVGILTTRYDVSSFWLVAPAAVLMAIFASALFGAIALRVSGIYFLLVTFALGQLIFGIAIKWKGMTGGSDGLAGVPYPELGFSLSSTSFYYFVLVVLIVCTAALYRLTKSPFGNSLQGIREDETRMSVLGYNTWFYKYIALLISGLFGGVAGMLYIYFNGLIAPETIGMVGSGSVIIMTIIGGSGTLWGALIGSAAIFLLEYFSSLLTPERWPIILGACFVAAVMFARGGIFPRLARLWMKASGSAGTKG
jgi:branched-chain amino acid transport system permease protein